MNKTQNMFQSLDSIELVKELSDEAAATCAGGESISYNFSGSLSSEGGQISEYGEINGVTYINQQYSFP
jgi:hypothetical protein